MKIYIISDIHIKSETKGGGPKLLGFLKTLPADVTHLILLGDIFDIWIGPHEYYAQHYPHIVDALKKIRARGVEVHYFEGNHDMHLKKYWQNQMDFIVHDKPHYFNFDGLIVRAEHGDLMNPNDKGYLFLRSFLRSTPMNFVIHHVPGKIIHMIGKKGSQSSRLYGDRHNKGYTEKVILLTRTHAQKAYKEKSFDLIVTGHTHIDDDFTFEANGKKVRSINLGSWLDKPKALIITPKEQLITLL